MSFDELVDWLKTGTLGPCGVGVSRAVIEQWLGTPDDFGYDGRRRRPDRDLVAFRGRAFQVGFREERVVFYGLYFRHPEGAVFFSELGNVPHVRFDQATSPGTVRQLLDDAHLDFVEADKRFELTSGVTFLFDGEALDSIQVSRSRTPEQTRL